MANLPRWSSLVSWRRLSADFILLTRRRSGLGERTATTRSHPQTDPEMFDFDRLDKLIHEKGRLAIMTLLAVRPDWPFQDLKAELKMSDGNLITHLRALHQAGYIAYRKEILTRPQTRYELTSRGKKAFQNYLHVLEEMVRSV